jgi:hypothetical protein
MTVSYSRWLGLIKARDDRGWLLNFFIIYLPGILAIDIQGYLISRPFI